MNELATQILAMGRPDRATDRTRKAIELAVACAEEYGDQGVGSPHLLCGLVREAEGVAFHVLDNLGLSRKKLDALLRPVDRSETKPTTLLDDDVATVMNAAMDGVALMHHNHLGTEHLLLGVVAPGTKSASLLAGLGIGPESVTHEVYGLMGHLR